MLLSARLSKLFEHDKYADSHGVYRVSSLYFDTPYDKALKEKNDGLKDREKFRIRYYNSNMEFIKLEKKMKTRGLCGKKSAKLTVSEVDKILRGENGFLLESKNPLLIEFYSKIQGQQLKPKKIVEYEREAFTYKPGNVRITIDRNLSTHTDPKGFLSGAFGRMNVSEWISVLEVKYDEFLPDIVKMAVQGFGRNSMSYSKYAMVRRYE